ncbi:EF-hand domain-containing protein [Tamlana sp. 2_MG-2023]|uniref:EF-hand domain-containing protein n=1 Tax=unclassified Tamlana TaxID=2614803 RepID=UPI0026E2AC97|nr:MULTISPECIES: EF-hand domain-containing protein [unclassified Tamlana]MDO6760079.1 EF-hand domain-containing protein [Tamlana sp. 2_MG-2023]MDO6790223.1 EF-hand domain-containing protein [Tamlana sp. 1_MG-2023]
MKSNLFTTLAIVFGITVLSTTTAFSQGRGERKGPPEFSELLEKLDENEDGKLSESEVKGPLKDQFSEIDTDEDGFITEEEFKNAPKPQGRKRN